MERTSLARIRWRLHEVLEVGSASDRLSLTADTFLVALIVVNVIAFSAGTVASVAAAHGAALEAFNVASVLVFTVEYVLRLWVCVDLPELRHLPRLAARARFAARPLLVIDFLAFAPFYLGGVIGLDLRVLRVLRLLRLLKLARYSPALQTLVNVLRQEARALIAAVIVMLSLLLFAATALHFIEGAAQPGKFGSVPAAMWWAAATLTTVGYGDVIPLTPLGKLVGGLVMIFGLAMFALPIGILSTGFAQEIGRQQLVVTWSMLAEVPMFARLGAAELSRIVRLLKPHRFPSGVEIMRRGDPPDGMYFIISGSVRIETEGKVVTLSAGDHFGEMALLEGRRRSAAATATAPCHLLELTARDFDYLLRTSERLADEIRRIAELRLAGTPEEDESL